MKTIVTFGEIMGRFAPPSFRRLRQAVPGHLELSFGGAEANVAASVAQLGGSARFVTALPTHALADACVGFLDGLGVDTSCILRVQAGRIGLYFIETGANQRPSSVLYDRSHSSISLTRGSDYDWDRVFEGACWLHTTGITSALSKVSAEAVQCAVGEAGKRGIPVSCDLNFRKKLWNWEPGTQPRALAMRVMRELLPFVDLVIANEEDAADVLDIHAPETNVASGKLNTKAYPWVAKEVVRQFPNVKQVAITLRESISASHNNWGAMFYDARADRSHFAPMRGGEYVPYEIRDIVDRVGAGDSFGAGLIFALNTPELAAPDQAVAFAVAASCLAHSIPGDVNFTSRAEVEALMRGSGSGRVVR